MNRMLIYGRLIKFSHTVFALPFALAAVLLAYRQHPIGPAVLWWILLAMASARSAAMGFNRYVDYEYDRCNPRTTSRPLTAGHIDKKSVLLFVLISSCLFVISAGMLGRLCLAFSLPVLSVLFLYSYTKRFTRFSHLVLGFAIGLAPIGAWIATTGGWDLRILPLSLALMTYIAGFDILYACQDIEFDRKEGLFSLPVCWGVEPALRMSSFLHGLTFFFLLLIYFAFHLGPAYLAVLLIISILLFAEHKLIQPHHLERVNFVFFHINSVVSVLLLLAVLMDTWMS
jgi:4-hydroxybenzoate polyprenyltransferase